MMQRSTPHLEKLQAALENEKLPASDRPRLEGAIVEYRRWIADLEKAGGAPDQVIRAMVERLNKYKTFIDTLIFDSPDNFLYRQKGQLKLDNSIIEEFLPWLLRESVIPGIDAELEAGPTNCYAAIYFESSLSDPRPGAGIRVRTKDQDFALARKLHVRASHRADFKDAAEVETHIAYVATEVKTNLDKTMFQEACATARDLRIAVPSSRYFLMCEWLDMTPISTGPTDIEEVLVLRGKKRLGSNVRKDFDTYAKRSGCRESYVTYLSSAPLRAEVFKRWVGHITALLRNEVPVEEDVLAKGYF